MGQGYNTRTLLFANRSLIVFALLLILLLSGIQYPKFVVPVGLERIRYQPVRRVHVKVAPLSQIGVDSSLDDAFEPLLRGEQAVLVVDAGNPVAMITRADLLEFVAHRGQG